MENRFFLLVKIQVEWLVLDCFDLNFHVGSTSELWFQRNQSRIKAGSTQPDPPGRMVLLHQDVHVRGPLSSRFY